MRNAELIKEQASGNIPRGSAANQRLLLALLCLANLVMVGSFFMMRYWMSPDGFIFFDVDDRFMDLINPMREAQALNPYLGHNASSPPFMFFIAYVLSLFRRLAFSEGMIFFASMAIIFVIMLLILFSLHKEKLPPAENICLSILFLASYPFFYTFDRGNFVLFAAFFVAAFIWAYHKERFYWAAIFLGLAAAVKLYPAVLGVVFLANKKFRQAIVCAVTGVAATAIPLSIYQGGFSKNLEIFLNASGQYADVGNGILGWLVNVRSSFYQLILIPKMIGVDPLEHIWQVPEFISLFRILLTALFILVILYCFFTERTHDQILLLTVMMIGYPIESGAYNLVLFIVPFAYWAVKEKRCPLMMVLGVLVMTCLNGFVAFHSPVTAISLQAVLNPVFLLCVLGFLIFSKRSEMQDDVQCISQG